MSDMLMPELKTEFVIDGKVVHDMSTTIGEMKLYIWRDNRCGEEECILYFVNRNNKVVGKLFVAAEAYGEGNAAINFT